MSSLVSIGKKIIEDVIYLTLATVNKQGVPWCTPVFTAFNKRYIFYWASGFETRHSENIRANPQCGAIIYDSSREEDLGEGVYMEGRAEELNPTTWQEGFKFLRYRSKQREKYYPPGSFQTLGPVRIYCFVPEAFYMLDPDGDPHYSEYADCRIKIDMFEQN